MNPFTALKKPSPFKFTSLQEGKKNTDVVGAQLREYLKGCDGKIKI
jgi:hypothetical protein